MPQISKIRIVNFNYNDGNRFIPDELYDLASPDTGEALNTLFNLNNGGGKTVLVQLMMQPVHPKAMAGGRRIEDYFSHTGDHSYILLEWNLDGSKEKLLTGISIAASSSSSTEEDKRGNSVKYYTFTTHYDTYSAYSISSLELSGNDNGNYVPAQFDYVREKAKSSRGLLTYYSSDDAVKWAEFLAEYGIFRTEWESVIEVLNKDEGGLNQYFDEAKTSDKLIAKFFIPAIEQKLMSVASKGTDCSLETMLINYAKKITDKESVIKQRDTNKKLLAGILVTIQNKVFDYLRLLDSGKYTDAQLKQISDFMSKTLCCRRKDIGTLQGKHLAEWLHSKLNRPIRVCGMVKNVGEPGGGPFLAYNSDGTVSPQILESSQIDLNDEEDLLEFHPCFSSGQTTSLLSSCAYKLGRPKSM